MRQTRQTVTVTAIALLVAVLLAACAGPDASLPTVASLPTMTAIPVTATLPINVTSPPPVDAATADPALPAVLLHEAVDGHTLSLLRYNGPEGVCLALSFDTRTFPVTHCGVDETQPGSFTASLTAPDGQPVHVLCGQVGDSDATAVAVEFASGASASAPVEKGAFLLVLAEGQTPRRAVAINQYGNLVGTWSVTP